MWKICITWTKIFLIGYARHAQNNTDNINMYIVNVSLYLLLLLSQNSSKVDPIFVRWLTYYFGQLRTLACFGWSYQWTSRQRLQSHLYCPALAPPSRPLSWNAGLSSCFESSCTGLKEGALTVVISSIIKFDNNNV